jgi:GAF domain-containing protein
MRDTQLVPGKIGHLAHYRAFGKSSGASRSKEATMHREIGLSAALFELSDIHVDDFDASSYTQLLVEHSTRLLHADAASLLLTGEDGALYEQGSTSTTARRLQLLQMRLHAGPGVDSVRTALPVCAPDLHSDAPWPQFRQAALNAGFAAVHTLPLRVREDVIGSMSLFRHRAGGLSDDELAMAESLVHVATAFLLLNRAMRKSEILSRQLQSALNTRVAIEQAKGILAGRRGSTLAGALDVMRTFARHDHRQLDEVAHAVIDGSPSVSTLSICRKTYAERNGTRRTG